MNRLRCVLFLVVASVCLSLAAPFVERAAAAENPAAVDAFFTVDASGGGTLFVRATLAPGFHTYSVTEAAEPNRTSITLVPSAKYRQAGAIRADVDPRRSYQAPGSPPVETHEGAVTWTMPVRFAPDVNPTDPRLQIGGLLKMMVCNDQSCQPIAGRFEAAYRGAAGQGTVGHGAGAVEQGIVERGLGTITGDAAVAAVAGAQPQNSASEQYPTALNPTALTKPGEFDNILGGVGGEGESTDQLTIKASVKPAAGDKPAELIIEGTIAAGWHIFSITQPKGGPAPTKIDVKITGDASLAGPFKSDPEPKKHFDSEVFKITLEEHEGKVRWTAPLKIAKGAEATGLKIHGTVSAQACSDKECVQRKVTFVALDSTKKAEQHIGQYRAPGGNVIIRGHIEPGTVAPGGTIKLFLTAEPQGSFHVYPVKEKPKVAKPTRIVISDVPAGWTVGEPTPNSPPVTKDGDAYHNGPVTWTIAVRVPDNTKAGSYTLEGGIAFMACEASGDIPGQCELPKGVFFSAAVGVGSGATSESRPLVFVSGTYGEVERRESSSAEAARVREERMRVRSVVDQIINATDRELYSHGLLGKYSPVNLANLSASKDPSSVATAPGGEWLALLISLGGGFLGGLILNVMPCVLPVIGLKILSFVQQGGESRKRVFLLNVWFSAGLISVFMVLAALAAFAALGWGAQFQDASFTVVLACIVFAFALAMVGVWEVPIPGFIGSSGTVNDLAAKEGPAGAFTKGVLTTLLATPCTGPFLGPALAWAVNQPVPVVFAMFASVGLGMASPYLLIGAFPKLIGFLPRPGAWMETFKKLMGFVLMATVVWLLSFVPAPKVVPAITAMCGLGFAFWWIGRVPLTEPGGKRALAWIQGALVIAGVWFFSFHWLDTVMQERADRRFKSDMVSRLVRFGAEPEMFQKSERPKGRYTVMVDFTADWCLTCKTNEQFVLSSKKTKDLIEQNNVIFLVADLTAGHEEAEDLLVRLGNSQRTIPYVAIFPADNPNQPIVLDGLLTQSRLDEALKKAGPSQLGPGATAMRNETVRK